MRNINKRLCSLLLVLIMCAAIIPQAALAADAAAVKSARNDTAKYVYETVKAPQVGSIGGEWAVLGLARSGYSVPDSYYQAYYAAVEDYVKACDGVLHEKKYTEYSRVTIALTAIGKDPRDVAGYNLLTPLGDFEKTVWQGINGPTFALIALDSGNYPVPVNKTAKIQATRDMYIDEILRRQLNDGGFSLSGGTTESSKNEKADADVTAMVLQALAKYQGRSAVKTATAKALVCLSNIQKAEGGFASFGTTSTESAVQVIVALCELGIPLDDARFVKNGKTVMDALLSLYTKGNGFSHASDGSGNDQMPSEQGLYGLTAAVRAAEGKNTLYRMYDALQIPDAAGETQKPGQGLPNKNKDVKNMPVVLAGKTFEDIQSHKNRQTIEALASRKIINGKTDKLFDPNATMTRAEFCTIVVNSLGLTPKANPVFTDVPKGSWYEGYVGTAYSCGIVTGTSATTFNPTGTITKQEAALMVMRAAKLAGMDTEMTSTEIRDMLSQFSDYTSSAEWARGGLAFCYEQNFLEQSDLKVSPQHKVTRAEMAEVLFRMLGAAKLL